MSATTTPLSPLERERVADEQAVPTTAAAPTSTPIVEAPSFPATNAPTQATEQAEQQQQPAPVSDMPPVTTAPVAPPGAISVAQYAPTPSVAVAPLAPIKAGPGLLVRGLWFLLVGWWLGYIWSNVALIFEWSIIGLPLAALMFNRLPQVMTLKPAPVETDRVIVSQTGAATPVIASTATGVVEQPFWLRAVYFVLVGWWLSFLWLNAAYFAGVTIIGLPLMFWMVNRIPAITTLSRL